jgi:hypothetical protein
MCDKINYKTKGHALAIARKREKETLVPYRAYLCNKCKCFHLSSKMKRSKIKSEAHERISHVLKLWEKDNAKRNSPTG